MPEVYPTYFISHGGGPWPYMKDEVGGLFDQLSKSLIALGSLHPHPRAVLVVTAHWEEHHFTCGSHPNPGMIYDYSGFPPHTYQVKYQAPGSPEIANRACELLRHAGIESKLNPTRGFDHGTFVPLQVIYPKAEIPVVQMSILRKFDPGLHMAAGRALSALRREGVLIIGSGLSYHNLGRFGKNAQPDSQVFDRWLNETLVSQDLSHRNTRICEWTKAPSARAAHPREDHLMPLFIALGAAENDIATTVYHEDQFMGGVAVSSFRFG